MAFENLRLERSPGGVATLTIDRPERKNAADLATFDELRRAFDEVAERAEVRVLVLTGAGDAFCSGADLTMGGAQRSTLDVIRRIHAGVLALSEIPKPTIAKVNGAAAGAGMNLALGCDLIVAARGARFSEIFTRRGLSIDYGGSWLLPRLIGLHRAKELVLLGDFFSAEEAERIGLINRAVPDAELDAFVDAWAERLAAGPPLALSMAKRLLNAGLDATLPQALENEAMAQAVNSGTEDMREAFQAFREKREPRFGGR